MQRKYASKGVKVVGIATLDSLESAEEYVKNMGDRMAYTIAYDKDEKLWNSWMGEAGQTGIPYSFIVDRKGNLAWSGHPFGIDFVLDQVVDGTFDTKKHAALVEELDGVYEAVEDKNVRAARRHVEALARLDPDRAIAWTSRVRVESELGTDTAARDAAEKGLARLRSNPHQLDVFVEVCFVKPGYAKKHIDLAIPVLAAVYKKETKSTELGLTYSCVLAKSGNMDSALAVGERHLARIADDDIALHRMAEALGDPASHERCVGLALKAIDRAIELRPGEADYLKLKFTILVQARGDIDAAKKTGAVYLETLHRPSEYNSFAWWLLTAKDAKGKFAELALAAAERMGAEAKDARDQNHIDTLALAKFENGFVDEAIELQARAVKLCRDARSRKDFTERLKRYKAAKRNKARKR